MPRVFISYCHADVDFADVVRARIQSAGLESWIDLEGLRAGEDWRQDIDQGIRDSIALITIMTPAAKASPYVTYEWAFALGAGLPVVPLLLSPTELHPRLSALQYLNFTQRETRPWPALLERLQTAASARPARSVNLPRTAPAIVQQAVAALDSGDEQASGKAVASLAIMNLPEATEALVQALNHPLPAVRIDAAWCLAKRGDVRAVPGLIEGNRERRWHYEFARAVAPIGSAALPGLLVLAADADPVMRRDLVFALEAIGDKAAVPEVIKLVEDADARVRGAALQALWHFGTREAVEAVERSVPRLIHELASNETSVHQEARQTLERIGNEPALAALAAWERTRAR
jgi:HEAT repeat protein